MCTRKYLQLTCKNLIFYVLCLNKSIRPKVAGILILLSIQEGPGSDLHLGTGYRPSVSLAQQNIGITPQIRPLSFPSATFPIRCSAFTLLFDGMMSATGSVVLSKKKLKKLRGFSPQANYTDQATAACRRS
jgi:hypothetical protein